jgi:hypothetical protein
VARSTEKKGEAKGKPERKRMTIYLPPEQWRALKVRAAQHDRQMSEIVSEALKKLGIDR